MMKLSYVQLREFFDSRLTDPYAQKRLRSVALGIAVGRQLPMASSAIAESEVKRHFNDNINTLATEKISVFNEQLVIDFEEALQVARAIWIVRYRNLFPSKYIPLLPGDDDIFVKLSEASAFFSPELHAFMNQNKTLTVTSVNRVTQVLYPDVPDEH